MIIFENEGGNFFPMNRKNLVATYCFRFEHVDFICLILGHLDDKLISVWAMVRERMRSATGTNTNLESSTDSYS